MSDAEPDAGQEQPLTIEEMGVRARRQARRDREASLEIPPGARTIKALRDRRRVIE